MMTQTPPISIEYRIQDVIAKLRTLREGDQAVLELIACGQAAVEPLREFLFSREPSGIFQARCQAVEALAALDAKEVLLDFLTQPRDDLDPVEQAGEDAVTNAVARALMKWPDNQVFSQLLEVVERKMLAGVVEALSKYQRDEVMPILSAAMGEDFCRPVAEEAFRKMGTAAYPHLLQLVDHRTPSTDDESESSLRCRRSALKLFAQLYQSNDLPKVIRLLMSDDDSQVAFLACSICLPRISSLEQEKVAERLIELLDSCDWMLRAEIEDLLVLYYAACRTVIENSLIQAYEPVAASLQRVVNKACPPHWLASKPNGD